MTYHTANGRSARRL